MPVLKAPAGIAKLAKSARALQPATPKPCSKSSQQVRQLYSHDACDAYLPLLKKWDIVGNVTTAIGGSHSNATDLHNTEPCGSMVWSEFGKALLLDDNNVIHLQIWHYNVMTLVIVGFHLRLKELVSHRRRV